MDESHLNAPTVHVNTADLPTVSASIASGVTLDGQFSTHDSVVTFSTVGCRAN
jgi:hypothetical protein